MGELIVHGLRMAFIIAICTTFGIVILNLLNLLGSIVFGGVVGEVFGIISMCLPFDMSAVMAGIGSIVSAILAFLVGHKIYNMLSGYHNS